MKIKDIIANFISDCESIIKNDNIMGVAARYFIYDKTSQYDKKAMNFFSSSWDCYSSIIELKDSISEYNSQDIEVNSKPLFEAIYLIISKMEKASLPLSFRIKFQDAIDVLEENLDKASCISGASLRNF